MKPRILLSVIAISLSLALVAATLYVEADPSLWQPVGPGIDYLEFYQPGPNQIFVARMQRNNLDVTLESSIAKGRLASGRETVSDMALRYDQALNNWGGSWGARNRVVVAINGFFFDYATDLPYRGVVHSSWYAKRFDDGENGTGFAWTLDRIPFIGGGCITHPADKNVITFLRADNYGKVQTINGVNSTRSADQLVVYTAQYDSDTNSADGDMAVEVLVEMTQPAKLISGGRMVIGYVREIRDKLGSTPLPFDHIVLSAHGAARTKLLNNVAIGDAIGLSQKIKDYDVNTGVCSQLLSSFSWDNTYSSIGGSYHFLKEGKIQSFSNDAGATARHPRTAIAYNDDYLFFIVVDGRDPFRSIGMTIDELAAFTKDTLQATSGIAQDGGGSSTMAINGRVVNNTYCNNLFCPIKTFIPLVAGAGSSSQNPAMNTEDQQPDLPGASLSGQDVHGSVGVLNLTQVGALDQSEEPNTQPLQRLVANGMLMVVVEPITQTVTYSPGGVVVTASDTSLYLGPGSNYATLTTVSAGTQGVVLSPLNGLNGVLAKGFYWWKIDFGGVQGWISELSLAAPASAQPRSPH